MKRTAWVTFLVGVFALPAVAAAHNLGHVFLPDGTCLEIASAMEAPFVGKERTQLDLVPSTANPPRDEYGVSFVGYWGQTPILPGRCPATAAVLTAAQSNSMTSSAPPARGTAQPASRSASAAPSGPWIGAGHSKDK